jgi:hypothetical protein
VVVENRLQSRPGLEGPAAFPQRADVALSSDDQEGDDDKDQHGYRDQDDHDGAIQPTYSLVLK